jgi:hypothetical protein
MSFMVTTLEKICQETVKNMYLKQNLYYIFKSK